MDAIKNNPAIAIGIARAIITAALMLGLSLSSEQEAAIVVIVQLALTLITARVTVPKAPTASAPPTAIQQPVP